jgi:hypothetical protein
MSEGRVRVILSEAKDLARADSHLGGEDPSVAEPALSEAEGLPQDDACRRVAHDDAYREHA